MLIEPNQTYINVVAGSKNYLNNPKCILNWALDSLYRQGLESGKSLGWMEEYLKYYHFDKPVTQAKDFFLWRQKMKMTDFDKLVKTFCWNELPQYILDKDKKINAIETQVLDEKWRYGERIYVRYGTFQYNNMKL